MEKKHKVDANNNNKGRELYVCVTLYHLYLSLLCIGKNKSKFESIILLNANDQQIYLQFCKLEPVLKDNGYKVMCRLRNKTKDILGLEGINNRKQFNQIKEIWGQDAKEKYVLYNFAWNLQYVYSTANLFFKNCREAYFIEEGALTAINPAQSKIKVLVKKITGTVVDFYKEEKVKAILVQKPEIYPLEWRTKLQVLKVDEWLSCIDSNTQNIILKIFLGDFLDTVKSGILNDVGIVYTQPLSEDGFITETEKIDYYHKMVKFYSRYGKPIVKLHPRDMTDYKFDEGITVMPSYFPSELLNLLDIRFLYAVGICTSAVPTSNAEYRVNTNENFLTDLKFYLRPLK